MKLRISPSILNCDMGRLADELATVDTSDRIHVDVMDNHFVPNLSWGLPVVEAAKKSTTVPIEAHLMIEDPDRWAPGYADAGCEMVTFHQEATQAPVRLSRLLRERGTKAGIAIRPITPVEPILEYIDEFDLVLVMTVEPGFGGQKFLPEALGKATKLREAVSAAGLATEIQVDGGVNRDTIAEAAAAGANNFVVGSALFATENRGEEIQILRQIARENSHTCC